MKIYPWTLGKCPTSKEVLSAWEHRGDSQKDFIWLLSVLSELSCYVDCSLRQLGGFGNIAGRQGGLKDYLMREVPSLAPKYKSVSRYASLALRLRKVFNFYPPAVLAQLHPDLPHPEAVNLPFITNYANELYRKYFSDLPPTYVAFKEIVDWYKANGFRAMAHIWGRALPQSKWPKAEKVWRRRIVRPMSIRYAYRRKIFAELRASGGWEPR